MAHVDAYADVNAALGEGMLVGGCQNNQPYCTINEAKCAGTGQNNTFVEGSLDCELDSKHGDDANKGSACIDNLSTGKAHNMYNAFNEGTCMSFNSVKPIFGVTVPSPEKNTVTKMMLAHPHKANKKIGVFAMKRMLCVDGHWLLRVQGGLLRQMPCECVREPKAAGGNPRRAGGVLRLLCDGPEHLHEHRG